MNEYIFFDATLRDRFIALVTDLGLHCSTRPDPIAGYVVAVSDDLDDETATAIEDQYDLLMDDQCALVEAADHTSSHALMAVNISLPDGRPCTVRIPARYGRRLVEHFTFDEINELVRLIAEEVLEPVGGPICREGQAG